VPQERGATRPNQKMRTRKDLLRAAARLMQQGRKPSLEEAAEEALVSRATAYRYFPSVEALLLEASLDVAVPEADEIFRDGPAQDPVARLERVDGALHDMILANEASLRLMLANSLQRGLRGGDASGAPPRQNRRTPLIEAALEPARGQFRPAALKTLGRALALVVGTEAMVVCKDVLQLDESEARKVRRWAIRALVDAARNEAPRAAAPDGRRGGRRG
jgi:AcrR family transcriptional regulator